MNNLKNDPEYIQYQRELQELQLMLGTDKRNSGSDDMIELLNSLSKDGQKLSPEMIQTIMMKELMPDMMLMNDKDVL